MKNIFKTALNILLGIFFIMAGGKKLLGQEARIDSFFRWDYPLWFLYLIGAIELVGGISLLIPQLRFFAILMISVTMIGASITHFLRWPRVPFPSFSHYFSYFGVDDGKVVLERLIRGIVSAKGQGALGCHCI